jgi:hypothetical protein
MAPMLSIAATAAIAAQDFRFKTFKNRVRIDRSTQENGLKR